MAVPAAQAIRAGTPGWVVYLDLAIEHRQAADDAMRRANRKPSIAHEGTPGTINEDVLCETYLARPSPCRFVRGFARTTLLAERGQRVEPLGRVAY